MRIGLLAFILGVPLSACAATTDTLSPAFDGEWDMTPAACADPDGLTRLVIAGTKLQYYEWGGYIRSARSDGDGSVRIDLDWWSIDDADANDRPVIRRRTDKLTLSPDRSRLTVAIDNSDGHYIRCSKA